MRSSSNRRAASFAMGAAIVLAFCQSAAQSDQPRTDKYIRYSQVGFQHIHKPNLAQTVTGRRGKIVVLDGSEYQNVVFDELDWWRYDFVKHRLKFEPGGLDSGQSGDMDCFMLDRRYSLMNPGGAFTFYIRIPKETDGTPITIELDVQSTDHENANYADSVKTLALFVDGVKYKQFSGRSNRFHLQRCYAGLVTQPHKAVDGLHRLTLADTSPYTDNQTNSPGVGFGIIDAIRIGAAREIEVVAIANNFDTAYKDKVQPFEAQDHQADGRFELRAIVHRRDPIEILPEFRTRAPVAGYNILDKTYSHHFMDWEYPGSVHAFIANRSDEPVKIEKILFGGVTVQEAMVRGDVLWHRAWPNPIQPGKVSEIIVRLNRYPRSQPVRITAVTSQGTIITGTANTRGKGPSMQYIATGPYMKDVHAYVSMDPRDDIDRVFVEGEDRTNDATIALTDGTDSRVAYIHVELPRAWVIAEPITVDVTTKRGQLAAGKVRAFDAFFGLGSYGSIPAMLETSETMAFNMHWATSNYFPREEYLAPTKAKGFGFIASAGPWIDTMLATDETADPAQRRARRASQFCGMYMRDEVNLLDDWSSQRSGYLAQWLEDHPGGAAATREQYPKAFIASKLRANYSPVSFFTWGQFGDITGNDHYVIKNIHQDMKLIYSYARGNQLASRPHATVIVLQLEKLRRLPSPQEMRYMQHMAVAGGAKGLSYWAYFPGDDRYGDRSLLKALGKTHRELNLINDQLALSHPVDIVAEVSSEGVFIKTLQSTTEGIAVVIINNNYEKTPFAKIAADPENHDDVARFTPVGPVKVRLNLPNWMNPAWAKRLNDTELEPVRIETTAGSAVFELKELQVAQVVWIENSL